ncbi:MAG: dTDP-4-dehydrorhamnose reductase, partial [Flavobacterium sp.]|nr:dTDP-4-dehydrorhamnose reductase [Flavobacterium sp.]
MVVLVTGAKGQLGQSLQFIASNYPEIQFIFCDSSELDITNLENVENIFNLHKPNYCINTAAYTAVDKAESESDKAYLINCVGAKNVALQCKKHDTILLHISTDFVFDGELAKLSSRAKSIGYNENDITNPTGVYGQTKLAGEKAIQELLNQYFIIRTSWVYSQFGNNFMKTMLRLASERESLSVVNDQIGTPTNAVDLAKVLVKIISHLERSRGNFGIYNFSNEGQCSWYDFAKKIFEINTIKINVVPISTTEFPTPA